jgi:hypothetical protein
MADTLTVTITTATPATPFFEVAVDGDPTHPVYAVADVTTLAALDALANNGLGSRVRVERRDPRPPLIVGINEVST